MRALARCVRFAFLRYTFTTARGYICIYRVLLRESVCCASQTRMMIIAGQFSVARIRNAGSSVMLARS
jgi:hypothetical protein